MAQAKQGDKHKAAGHKTTTKGQLSGQGFKQII